MALPTKIKTAISADLHEMLEWTILLNFFHDNQDTLSLPEKISIYAKCEDFRKFWNTMREEPFDYVRNSGDLVTLIKISPSLNIDKHSVNPGNIYTDTDLLEHFKKEKESR
jgi:hypothetical protein